MNMFPSSLCLFIYTPVADDRAQMLINKVVGAARGKNLELVRRQKSLSHPEMKKKGKSRNFKISLSLPPPLLIFLSAVQTIHGHFSEAFNKDRKNIFITNALSRNCLSAFTNKKFNIISCFVLSLLPGVVLILW